MAKLKDFRTDTQAINDGVWIKVGAEFDDLEILTRGFTDQFFDAQEARLERAAQAYGGDRAKIPNAERRTVNASLLEDFLVLDVRNLDDEGKPVSKEDFYSMLYTPQYGMLARACWSSAGKVSSMSAEKLKVALGNFDSSSTST